MEFVNWKPIYKEIISDFDYSEKQDRKAAKVLSKLRDSDSLSPLNELRDQTVEIIGPYFSGEKHSSKSSLIAAGSSLTNIIKNEVQPDLLVTDLDGDTRLQLEINLDGVPAVIHAHGDNIPLLKRWAKKFHGHVICTCQCRPSHDGIYNFGGFTDGDRACFIADHFEAKEIILNGWDFEEPFKGDENKRKKLRWAKKLIKKLNTPFKRI